MSFIFQNSYNVKIADLNRFLFKLLQKSSHLKIEFFDLTLKFFFIPLNLYLSRKQLI